MAGWLRVAGMMKLIVSQWIIPEHSLRKTHAPVRKISKNIKKYWDFTQHINDKVPTTYCSPLVIAIGHQRVPVRIPPCVTGYDV